MAVATSRFVFGRTNSALRIIELERKATEYETMIQRFQVRRVDKAIVTPESKLFASHLVVDKLPGNDRASRRRSFSRLAYRLHSSDVEPSGFFRPLHPDSRLATLHSLVIIATFYFQVFYLPFAPSFFPTGSNFSTAINVTLEVLAIVDIVMNFNTAYAVKRGVFVTTRWRIARRYLRTWLLFDAVAAFPLHALCFVLDGSSSTWHRLIIHNTPMVLMRLVRLNIRGNAHQVSDRLTRWIRYSKYSHLLGIVRLLWLVVVITHYMACFWHLLDDQPAITGAAIGEQYAANYFYAVILIHGQGDVSPDWGQNLFSTFAVLAGSVIVATIFGNVAMLVSNFNANATNYQRKMEGVFATMDKMELPDRLRDRIQQYFAHVWAEYESLDGDLVKFQRELTHTLGLEVGLFKYMGLVNDIPFWAECSPDFIAQIVMTLVVRVYLPDDFVVRQGEICSEMFMVNRGSCEVIATDSDACDFDAVIATLGYGQAFGEMSLLMNYKQFRNVRAVSFVETCVLQRASFQRLVSRHPVDRRRVLSAMVRSCIEKKEVPLEWELECRMELARRQECDVEAVEGSLTPTEAAEFLVARVDVYIPDSSIIYGFQLDMSESSSDHLTGLSSSVTDSLDPQEEDGGAHSSDRIETDLGRQLVDKLDELTAAVARIEAGQRCQSCRSKVRSASPGHREARSMTSRSSQDEPSGADSERLLSRGENQQTQSTTVGSVSSPQQVRSLRSDRLSTRREVKHNPLEPRERANESEIEPRALVRAVGTPPPDTPPPDIPQGGMPQRAVLVDSPPASPPTPALPPVVGGRESQHRTAAALRLVRTDAASWHDLQAETDRLFQPTAAIAPITPPDINRHRVSVDSRKEPSLRLRFLHSRLSNLSTTSGSPTGKPGPGMRHANTGKAMTLADQLYNRGRRQSRDVATAEAGMEAQTQQDAPAAAVIASARVAPSRFSHEMLAPKRAATLK